LGTIDLQKNPTALRWEKPAFDVSRDALFHGDLPCRDISLRDGRKITVQILENEVDRVFRHLESSLHGEKPLSQSAKKGLKAKLYTCIERNYQRLLDRLPMGGGGETGGLEWETCHTPKGIGRLLDSMGGADSFNTGEIEKYAPAKPWGHLEAHADGMLTRKDASLLGAAAFVGRENACRVVSCVFKDNAYKPKTVTDARLSLNIPEAGLVSAAFRYRAMALHLIREVICEHLIKGIDAAAQSMEAGGPGDRTGELVGRILELCDETAVSAYDTQDILRNLAANVITENTRRRGFDAALGLLVSALADCKLNHQFIENREDGYDVSIREYEDTEVAALPDERYSVRLTYVDRVRLDRECRAYDGAIADLDAKARHFQDLLEVIYQDSKSVFKVNDFEDFARKNRNRMKKMHKNGTGRPNAPSDGEKDELDSRSLRDGIRVRLAQMRERMGTVWEYLTPIERRVSEERLALLAKEHARLEGMINPCRIQPGLIVDFEISSIKRKKTTLYSVSKALDEFLKGLPGAFEQGAV